MPTTAAASGHLPLRDDKRAPCFKGKKVEEFISVLDHLAEANNVDKTTLPKAVSHYMSSNVRSALSAEPAFEGVDWDAAKEQLRYMYGALTHERKPSPKRLRRFVQDTIASGAVSSYITLDCYHIKFSEKAGNLVRDNVMSSREVDELFYQGLPKKLRRALMSDLGEAVRKRTNKDLAENNPPTKKEVLETARAYYKADAINDSLDSDSESRSSDLSDGSESDSSDDSDSGSDKKGKRRSSSSRPAKKSKKSKSKRERTRSHSDSEVVEPPKDFARQFQSMAQEFMRNMMFSSMAQAPGMALPGVPGAQTPQMFTLPAAPPPVQPAGFPMQASAMLGQGSFGMPRRCYVCGKTEGVDLDHPVGTRACPETGRLLSEKLVTLSPITGRLAWPDGTPLPNPNLLPGGYASFIRSQRAAAAPSPSQPPPGPSSSPQRDLPPHLASAMRVGLCRDGAPVFSYPTAASTEEVQAYSFVTTRSGADTGSDDARAPDATQSTPTRSAAPPAPATPTAQILPPASSPARSNTEAGWDDAHRTQSRPTTSSTPDRSRPTRPSNLRFSSTIRDSVSLADVEEHVLNTKITLTLRECLGMSTALQKRLATLVKTRREFERADDPAGASRTATYTAAEATAQPAVPSLSDAAPSMEAELSFEQGELLTEILKRYAASISLGQPRQFAMVSGTVEIIWGGRKIIVLVDSGSELNLICKSIFEASGLELDEDGARWSLRGIGGAPIPLLGCVRDASVQLAGKNFDHHFFVSSAARGIHDGILGQPWLSFFAAQFDYSRDGTTILRAYPSGSREGASVAVEICKANHLRNVDRLVLSASVAEGPVDSDFQ